MRLPTEISPHIHSCKLEILLQQEAIIAPVILPDEFAHGYLGRIRAVNILPQVCSAIALLKKVFLKEEELNGKARRARALAKVAGLSLEQFCQQHTLMPFLRATTNISPDHAHGVPESITVIEKSAFRLAMKVRMVCPECIREDMSFWGFSYWRRRHQLPGVQWCDKHHAPLMAIEQDFDVCPSASAISVNEPRLEAFESCICNPVIIRYVEIATGFLEMRRPLSFSDAARKLSLRAQQMGIRVSEKGRRPVLSDVALNAVPKAWLSSLFPGVETKIVGERFPAIDRVLLYEGLPQARALALALMFDSAEEALRYWGEPLDEGGANDTKSTLSGQDLWNSKKVFNIYVKSEGNRSEVARVIGVHSRRVSGELDRCGLPSLCGIQLETTGHALMAFYEGQPLTEACAIHGAELRVCEDLIRQSGARFAEAIRRIIKKRSRASSDMQKIAIGRPRKRKQFAQTQETPKAFESDDSEVALS